MAKSSISTGRHGFGPPSQNQHIPKSEQRKILTRPDEALAKAATDLLCINFGNKGPSAQQTHYARMTVIAAHASEQRMKAGGKSWSDRRLIAHGAAVLTERANSARTPSERLDAIRARARLELRSGRPDLAIKSFMSVIRETKGSYPDIKPPSYFTDRIEIALCRLAKDKGPAPVEQKIVGLLNAVRTQLYDLAVAHPTLKEKVCLDLLYIMNDYALVPTHGLNALKEIAEFTTLTLLNLESANPLECLESYRIYSGILATHENFIPAAMALITARDRVTGKDFELKAELTMEAALLFAEEGGQAYDRAIAFANEAEEIICENTDAESETAILCTLTHAELLLNGGRYAEAGQEIASLKEVPLNPYLNGRKNLMENEISLRHGDFSKILYRTENAISSIPLDIRAPSQAFYARIAHAEARWLRDQPSGIGSVIKSMEQLLPSRRYPLELAKVLLRGYLVGARIERTNGSDETAAKYLLAADTLVKKYAPLKYRPDYAACLLENALLNCSALEKNPLDLEHNTDLAKSALRLIESTSHIASDLGSAGIEILAASLLARDRLANRVRELGIDLESLNKLPVITYVQQAAQVIKDAPGGDLLLYLDRRFGISPTL